MNTFAKRRSNRVRTKTVSMYTYTYNGTCAVNKVGELNIVSRGRGKRRGTVSR